MFGESMSTGMLVETLARMARRLADDRDNGRPVDDDMVDGARQLMEGSTVLWMELTKEREDEARPTARRKVRSHGAVGRCNCGACNWLVSRYDAFCRKCGVQFTGTDFLDGGDES